MAKRVTRHARRRFDQRFGVEAPAHIWPLIVANAREGLYPSRRAKRRKPKGRSLKSRDGAALPVYDVPVDDGEITVIVPMVIDTTNGIVVTVLPQRLPKSAHEAT